MAVLVSKDWHPPRDLPMDAPSSNFVNSTSPRQRTSPPADHSASSTPIAQQAPYPYPVQQQQAGWTPPHPQQQYYPTFYQNSPHQQAYPLHPHPAHSPQTQIHNQNPYFDPSNAQFAQWAYQQMMFSAHQAHQMSHVPSPLSSSQRSRSGSASSPGDYYAQNQLANYNIFPNGTPPAHPSQLPPNGYPAGQGDHQQQNQYGGFHPYRRPQRQGSSAQDAPPNGDWRSNPPSSAQPPYVRAEPTSSSSSVNSSSTPPSSSRPRTNSNQGPSSQSGSVSKATGSVNGHGRMGSTNSSSSSVVAPQRPHQRTTSSSSNGSANARPPAAVPATTTSSTSSSATLRRPSPLSQGTFTAAEKRMSRDDSDLGAMVDHSNPGVRSGGLKGRLRRALSLNAGTTLREEDEHHETASKGKSSARTPTSGSSSTLPSSTQPVSGGDDESVATVQKKKSKSLFNSRFNRSTDNISLSSTMSSASMVIRKLGNLGKITRRNSLAGITSLFKDKKKDGEEGEGKKSKKNKKGEKGSAAAASVSHVTAELDRGDWSAELSGLTPAARLARQHTLKSNAEAAARAKAEAEAKAAATAAAMAQAQAQPANLPTTWEKNTTTRQGESSGKGVVRINDDGTRVFVEDEDSDSDDGHSEQRHHGNQSFGSEGWDDDEDWGEAQDEEDITIRAALESTGMSDEEDLEMEPWAINVRRSVERTRQPARGILKKRWTEGDGFDQEAHLKNSNAPLQQRHRSNSYDAATPTPELGPLAHIPSPDPDQIDGIHRHALAANAAGSSSSSATPSLPPLSFQSSTSSGTVSPKEVSDSSGTHNKENQKSPPSAPLFTHANSSAPALSVFSLNTPTLTHRSATAPTSKRLAFATNLSVYDTFPATVYDRRSEPATWSRLTPALAQRIKEELNSYKMEEMEVHASSRIHTQFFV